MSAPTYIWPNIWPPSGIESNFVDPESLFTVTAAVSAVTLGLAAIFVTVRLYSSIRITKSTGYGEYSCVLALVGSIAYVCLTISVASRFAKHLWDIPSYDFFTHDAEEAFFQPLAGALALCFSKVSLFLLFLRIFLADQRPRYSAYLGIVVSITLFLVTIVVHSALCAPRAEEVWVSDVVYFRCANFRYFGIIQGVLNSLLDLFLLYLPIPVVLVLQLPNSRKIGVMAILLTGLIACIASLLALIYKTKLLTSPDISWNLARISILNAVEQNLLIMCGCMPAFATFFHHTDSQRLSLPLSRPHPTTEPQTSEVNLNKLNTKRSVISKISKRSSEANDSSSHFRECDSLELGETGGVDFISAIGPVSKSPPAPSVRTKDAARSGGMMRSSGYGMPYGKNSLQWLTIPHIF